MIIKIYQYDVDDPGGAWPLGSCVLQEDDAITVARAIENLGSSGDCSCCGYGPKIGGTIEDLASAIRDAHGKLYGRP